MKRLIMLSLTICLSTVLAMLLWGAHSVQATTDVSAPRVSAPSSPNCGGWSLVPSPNNGQNENDLTAVSASSSTNAWAVGYYFPSGSITSRTLTESWNGTAWSLVRSPQSGSGNNALNGVVDIDLNTAWAVGASGTLRTGLIERWDGTKWSVFSSPSTGRPVNVLNAIAAVSPTDIWAVGYSNNRNGVARTLTEHWDGTQWSVIASPNAGTGANRLNGVAVVASGNVWAVGKHTDRKGNDKTLIEQWNGSQWSIVASPNSSLTDNELDGATAVSANAVWAVGTSHSQNFITQNALIERWDGSTWSLVPGANLGTMAGLSGAAAVSSNDVWAVGTYYNNNDGDDDTLTEQWNGSQWNFVSSPNGDFYGNSFLGAAVIPGTSDLWAVGSYGTPGDLSVKTLIGFYC